MNPKAYFRQTAGPSAPLVLAHRGYQRGELDGVSLAGLQNTLPAFTAAARLGLGYVETDIRVSADGELVCFHDPMLDDLCDMPGVISRMTWTQLSQARVRGRVPLTRLTDALEALPEIRFNVDIKDAAAARPFAVLIEKMQVQDRVLVASFSDARRRATQSRLAWPVAGSAGKDLNLLYALGRHGLPDAALHAVLTGVDVFQVPEKIGQIRLVTRSFVDRAHRLGRQVHVWTVNEAADMSRLLDLGVDGLVTDRPDIALKVIAERGNAPR